MYPQASRASRWDAAAQRVCVFGPESTIGLFRLCAGAHMAGLFQAFDIPAQAHRLPAHRIAPEPAPCCTRVQFEACSDAGETVGSIDARCSLATVRTVALVFRSSSGERGPDAATALSPRCSGSAESRLFHGKLRTTVSGQSSGASIPGGTLYASLVPAFISSWQGRCGTFPAGPRSPQGPRNPESAHSAHGCRAFCARV